MLREYLAAFVFFGASITISEAQTVTAPGMLPGEAPASVLTSENKQDNLLRTGVSFSSDFDDNAMNDDHNKEANLIAVVAPHIGWTILRDRTKWTLDYSAGFSASYPLSTYNSRSHIFDTNLNFKITKRFEVRVREDFLQSKNEFDRLQQFELTGSSLDRPNNFLATSAQTASEQAALNLVYAVSQHGVIEAIGSFYKTAYGLTSNQTLGNVSSTNGHIVYSHHRTRRSWIGFDYNVRNLISNSFRAHSLVQTVFGNETITFSPAMSLSIFAGPEYSRTQAGGISSAPIGSELRQSRWDWSAGTSYSWSSVNTTVLAQFVQRISDGQSFEGIVRSSNATAEVKRQMTHGWRAELLFGYDLNTPLLASFRPVSYVSFAAGINRTLSPHWSLDVRYWRTRDSAGLLSPPLFADHNRVLLSLDYELKQAIGR